MEPERTPLRDTNISQVEERIKMIDQNKPLEAYSDAELIDALNSKNEQESYALLKLVFAENARSDRYYSCFEDFLRMIGGKTSFTRMRGFGLCASLAKWDRENRIDAHLTEMLVVLEDEKPSTVRVALGWIGDMLRYKPYLAELIQKNLGRIDCGKYKDTMAPLIKKDVEKLLEQISSIV